MRNIYSGLVSALVCMYVQVSAAPIVLKAGSQSGADPGWAKNPSAGVSSWGFPNDGKLHEGNMWFDSFGGTDGQYKVEFGIVAENDGKPAFKLTAGTTLLKEGVYPVSVGCSNASSAGKVLCESEYPNRMNLCAYKAMYIDCGTHRINKGQKITIYGRTDVQCKTHGACARWYEVKFTNVTTSSFSPVRAVSENSRALRCTFGQMMGSVIIAPQAKHASRYDIRGGKMR